VRGRNKGTNVLFGKEKRSNEHLVPHSPRGHTHPGPGHYNLPSKLSEAPKYVMGNSPLKIHL